MKVDIAKWVYSFFMLFIVIGWAVFAVKITLEAMSKPTPVSVLEVSGASVLLGALIGWESLVVQHWFRKKTPTE